MIRKNLSTVQHSWERVAGNWSIYAAAAGASLALSTGAQASIVYSSLDVTVSVPEDQNASSRKPFSLSGVKAQGLHQFHFS
jgi:hypothetical protein